MVMAAKPGVNEVREWGIRVLGGRGVPMKTTRKAKARAAVTQGSAA